MVYAWCLQGCGVTHSPSNLPPHPPAGLIFRRCWDTAKASPQINSFDSNPSQEQEFPAHCRTALQPGRDHLRSTENIAFTLNVLGGAATCRAVSEHVQTSTLSRKMKSLPFIYKLLEILRENSVR